MTKLSSDMLLMREGGNELGDKERQRALERAAATTRSELSQEAKLRQERSCRCCCSRDWLVAWFVGRVVEAGGRDSQKRREEGW